MSAAGAGVPGMPPLDHAIPEPRVSRGTEVSATSRSAPGFPGRDERWAVWGAISGRARTLAIPDAADRIADLLLEVAA